MRELLWAWEIKSGSMQLRTLTENEQLKSFHAKLEQHILFESGLCKIPTKSLLGWSCQYVLCALRGELLQALGQLHSH